MLNDLMLNKIGQLIFTNKYEQDNIMLNITIFKDVIKKFVNSIISFYL